MSKIFELEASQRQMEDALKQERQQQAQARQALEKQVESFKCTICINNNVDHVLVPCGHTFCEDYCNQLQHNKCHYCRTVERQKVKLFIGNES